MNTRCSVCQHPSRAQIEAAHVGGLPLREIGKKFDRSKTTIAKHLKKCVPAAVQKALDAKNDREVEAGDAILQEIESLKSESKRLQALAEKKKDYRTAMSAIDKQTRLVELQARIVGQLRDTEINLTNVQIDPETAERMAQMFLARKKAVAPKPETIPAITPPSTVTIDLAVDSESRAFAIATASDVKSK